MKQMGDDPSAFFVSSDRYIPSFFYININIIILNIDFELGYYWRMIISVEKVFYSRYNKKSVQDRNIKKKILIDVAFLLCFMYNRQCWSLTAMMWKVADTPGRFAMASV
jgi:hypothetical protein